MPSGKKKRSVALSGALESRSKGTSESPQGAHGAPSARRNVTRKEVDKTSASRTARLGERAGRWTVLFFVFVFTILLLIPNYLPHPTEPDHPLNQKESEDFLATVSFSVTDHARLKEMEEDLTENKRFYYRYEKSNSGRLVDHCEALLDQARQIATDDREDEPLTPKAKLIDWAQTRQHVTLSHTAASTLLKRADESRIPTYIQTLESLTKDLYQSQGVVENLQEYRSRYERDLIDAASFSTPPNISQKPQDLVELSDIANYIKNRFSQNEELNLLESEDQGLLEMLVATFTEPNIVYKADVTSRKLQDAISDLGDNPPQTKYEKGQVLVINRNRITIEDLRLIREMDRVSEQNHYKRFLAITLYIALLYLLVCYYIHLFRPDLRFSIRTVLMVSLPVILALALGRLHLEVIDVEKFPDAAGYAFPAAIIGMLAVILFDARSAVLLVTIGSLAFTLLVGLDFKVFLVSLFGGYVAVTSLTAVQERKEMLKSGLLVGLANAVMILLIHYIDDPTKPRFDLMVWGIGNGLACGVITMPALVVFEKLFGIVTDIGLLELTGLDHPLLMELEEKAPGSFQHSLNVCKLSEAAAKAIGANYLLVRSGAYYHDVGKILKPKYSGENAISLEEKSLHSKLSPNMSAMIIKNHVKGGMDLARKYGLPDRVADFIPQHHGTTIIAYFYHEALKRFENSQSTDPVRESDFRYPGPKPQSIETAIVMLADAVEAATTSRFTSLTVNEDELQMCVQKIITDKFADGQFDECDLTLRDLHLIRESFVKTLLSRFHHRIAYPAKPKRSGPAAPTPKRDRMDRN